MITKRLKLADVDCKYGAPMGRCNWLPDNCEKPIKLQMQLVRMIAEGAYDHGGAYWGISNPLYCAWGYENEGQEDEKSIRVFVRGTSREHAKREVHRVIPGAKFFNWYKRPYGVVFI